MKIGFISADWSNIEDPETGHPTPGGAGWYRMALPAKYLARNGFETVHCELVSVDKKNHDRGVWLHDFDGGVHEDCDILVVQRWMDEKAAGVLELARAAGQIVVNDIDDWYWGLHPSNAAWKASDPKRSPKVNRDHYLRAVRASNHLTVSTPFLREKLHADQTPATLIRNGIDLERWTWRAPVDTPVPVVGWVGSTLHRSGDLETVAGAMQRVCRELGATFMHAGRFNDSVHAGELLKLDESILMTQDGCSILNYPSLFDSIDIGIVPLSYIPFNDAKSAIKGMEYAAAGIPFVAAATPEYLWLESTHGIGVTAKKTRDWVRELLRLGDAEERMRRSEASRASLEALDMATRWNVWADFYESIL